MDKLTMRTTMHNLSSRRMNQLRRLKERIKENWTIRPAPRMGSVELLIYNLRRVSAILRGDV